MTRLVNETVRAGAGDAVPRRSLAALRGRRCSRAPCALAHRCPALPFPSLSAKIFISVLSSPCLPSALPREVLAARPPRQRTLRARPFSPCPALSKPAGLNDGKAADAPVSPAPGLPDWLLREENHPCAILVHQSPFPM